MRYGLKITDNQSVPIDIRPQNFLQNIFEQTKNKKLLLYIPISDNKSDVFDFTKAKYLHTEELNLEVYRDGMFIYKKDK
mgnify:FL=1